MIRQVNIINDLGETLTLELESPEKSGLVVTNIEGIGLEKANININESSNMDGGTYNSAKIPSRNIVFYLRFLDYPSVEDNRHLTYKFFPLKKKIRIEFITDNRECYIYGVVESNIPNVFSKEEGCSISILCEDPNFYKSYGRADYDFVDVSGVIEGFEFPFISSNLIITTENDEHEIVDGFIFGESFYNNEYAFVFNDGDKECGCTMQIYNFEAGNTYNLNILNYNTGKIIIIKDLLIEDSRDVLYIESYPNKKRVYIYKHYANKKVHNKINNVDINNSDWILLERGKNIIQFQGIEYTNILAVVKYSAIYGGI